MKINTKQYAQVLYDLTDEKSEADVDDIIIKFAKELKKTGQLKTADKIIESFKKIWNKQNGILEAEVFSARNLEERQVFKIENYIKEKYKAKKVILKNKVDASLKGGIILKVGDDIIDGSIKKRIALLRESLRK